LTDRSNAVLTQLDHLVYATPDLARTVLDLTERLGIAPSAGGAHPGRGTRNALLALGPSSYLEIVGPDPEQAARTAPRWFGIDRLTAPRLVTWAAKGTALSLLRERALESRVQLGAVAPGARRRPDGVLLAWELTEPTPLVDDGIVPFFIDWGASPHPATNAAQGAAIVALRAEHPDAERVVRSLEAVDIALEVRLAATPSLIAIIATPHGEMTLC
jgi:hypothetical protein